MPNKKPAHELLDMTAEQMTAHLKSTGELTPEAKTVDGVGIEIFYKIGNTLYTTAGERFKKHYVGNGGKIKAERNGGKQPRTAREQVAKECEEETYGILPLTEKAQVLSDYHVKEHKHYTYVTFAAVDDTTFTSLAQFEAAIERMNPTAKLYNDIFTYVVGSVRGWEEAMDDAGHERRRAKLQDQYYELVREEKLLIDVFDLPFWDKLADLPKTCENNSAWWDTPNMKLIKEYGIGRYSERPSYHKVTAEALLQMTDKDIFNVAPTQMLAQAATQFRSDAATVSAGGMFSRGAAAAPVDTDASASAGPGLGAYSMDDA